MTASSDAPNEPGVPETPRASRRWLHRRPRTFSAIALLAALLLVFVARRAELPPEPALIPDEAPAPAAGPGGPVATLVPAAGPGSSVVTLVPAARELGAALADPDGSAEEDLQTLGQLLYLYRQAFGGNPEGGNEDLVAAFLGGNPGNAAFLSPGSPAIIEGKLVDRWGTPYWFHALSGSEMEVRSAGPDRELFTGDDLAPP